MGRRPEQTFLQGRHTDGQCAHEKMLNISKHHGNVNQNHNEISPYTCQKGYYQKTTNNKCGRGCEAKETLMHCWWECKLVQSLWKTVWRFLKKLKRELPYYPVIPLLGNFQKKTKALIRNNICTPMFIVALFTVAKMWKQPNCPSTNEWIKKMWCIYMQWNTTQP